METLTTIQEAAIQYLQSRSRPNDHRCHRKASRMVRDWCAAHGWDQESTGHAVRDMWDVYELQRISQ